MKIKNILSIAFVVAILATVGCIPENPNAGIEGCTDSQAVNFNPYAGTEDNSCVYVAQKQRSLFADFTATWCGPCGSYGMPNFNGELGSRNHDDVIGIAVHSGGSDFEISGSSDWGSHYGVTGIPTLTVLSKAGFMASSYTTAIDGDLALESRANSYVTAKVEGGNLNIESQTLFYQNVDGPVNVILMVLEDGIIGPQNGHSASPNTEHNHVIRALANGTWGTEIVRNAQEGDNITATASVAVDPSWNLDNCEVIAVIMEDGGAPQNLWHAVNVDYNSIEH